MHAQLVFIYIGQGAPNRVLSKLLSRPMSHVVALYADLCTVENVAEFAPVQALDRVLHFLPSRILHNTYLSSA